MTRCIAIRFIIKGWRNKRMIIVCKLQCVCVCVCVDNLEWVGMIEIILRDILKVKCLSSSKELTMC